MKQVIQNYKTGEIKLVEVPYPICPADFILVGTKNSLISIGTERAMIDLGKKSLLGKARMRPDLVKMALDKAKKEGFIKTFQEVLRRLDSPVSLGYSSAGVVLEVGENVNLFSPGDKVACVGAGFASHSEIAVVPQNLCCKIPEGLDFEEASFGMLGIIALHGIRMSNLNFGERVAVIGLGLIGLLAVQILKAYGCQVIATDLDSQKIELAKKLGIDLTFRQGEEFVENVKKFTDGIGVDAVILTVASKSAEPVNTAIEISRFGGRIVLIGVADIHPDRNELWQKEIKLLVSKGGGPGTLDPFYEIKGIDYPPGYVRWTENRNIGEFLRLISEKKVRVKPLITHRFDISLAEEVYKNLLENKGGPFVGTIFTYPAVPSKDKIFELKKIDSGIRKDKSIKVGVIGAGLFGKALFLPALQKIKGIDLSVLATLEGGDGVETAKKYGFSKYTSDYQEILADPSINVVLILTRHRTHAKIVIESLKQRKHTYVEKPLCINEEELEEIIKTYNSLPPDSRPILMVGYNRRFSSLSEKMKEFFAARQQPMVINYRVNPGFIGSDHWVHSSEEGGSRIVGEICHFVDMLQYLTGSSCSQVLAFRVSANNKTVVNSDNLVISLKFKDGSVGSIIYTGSGDKSFSRERIEVFSEGKTAVLEDYRKLILQKNGKVKKIKLGNQDMGYQKELEYLFSAIQGKSPILLKPEEIFLSTETIFKINQSLEKGAVEKI